MSRMRAKKGREAAAWRVKERREASHGQAELWMLIRAEISKTRGTREGEREKSFISYAHIDGATKGWASLFGG